MKILNRLTIKHLMMNKKRTIVTIIGIILSTALMVGIGLLVSTFLEAMRANAISYNGYHHAYFDFLSETQKEELKLNINFEETYSYGVIGYSNIDNTNEYKPYLYLISADQKYLDSETITEGRMPENSNEIVLPNHLINNSQANYKIGDEITLSIGPRMIDGEEVYDNSISLVNTGYYYSEENSKVKVEEKLLPKMNKTYKIVGIISRSREEDYSSPGYMAITTKEENIKYYRTYVTYKNVKKTYEKTSEICSNLKGITCQTNDSLLYYYGISRYNNINSAIVSVLSIALGLLSIGCIIVIYNSFAISTMERKKSFGLYSSLGATPKQIKYTVFFEAFLVGTIGIILGILSAFLGIYITISIISSLIGDSWGITLKFSVDLLYVCIPIIFMIFVVYFSAFIPARRSSKVTSIEMIKENDEIKIPRRKVKTPKWIRKIFGMEGEIALKNMKRNKRKYRITLLSLFISIVLFISFSTYLKLGVTITDFTDNYKYDILVDTSEDSVINEVKNMDGIEKYYISKMNMISTKLLDTKYYNKNYYKYIANMSDDSFINSVPVIELVLENQTYEDFANELKIDKSSPIFINQVNYVIYENNNRIAYQSKMLEETPSSLEFCKLKIDNSDYSECQKISPKYINELPELLKYLPVETNSSILVISESMMEKNPILKDVNSHKQLTIVSKNYKEIYDKIDKKYKNNNQVNYFSPRMELEEEKNSFLAIKILLYGFISLVSLTGITSVFNTIHTSIHLRRKEFAMLRSIGLSPNGFNRMIFFESLFFGLKSLFYALPVSFFFILLINNSINGVVHLNLIIPWKSIILAIIGVFLIIMMTMWYSVRKIKKENILDSLRDENI